jgi:hypothetical protein
VNNVVYFKNKIINWSNYLDQLGHMWKTYNLFEEFASTKYVLTLIVWKVTQCIMSNIN